MSDGTIGIGAWIWGAAFTAIMIFLVATIAFGSCDAEKKAISFEKAKTEVEQQHHIQIITASTADCHQNRYDQIMCHGKESVVEDGGVVIKSVFVQFSKEENGYALRRIWR